MDSTTTLPALGEAAFVIDPNWLMVQARGANELDHDASELIEEFAYDLATIQNLPVFTRTIPAKEDDNE